MTWRVVSISNRAKLDYKMNYLEVRQGPDLKRIHLSEISTLLLESEAISLTTYLINELVQRKINVVVCDEKHNPSSFVLPVAGSFDSSYQVHLQCEWKNEIKSELWMKIINDKISNQSYVLKVLGYDEKSKLLTSYSDEIELDDYTNREGFAAKVYFNTVLGLNCSRSDSSIINGALNYGYSILLSAFSRSLFSNGCITQIGIWHMGRSNNFNLSCDLMEAFRPIVDLTVFKSDFKKFEAEEKRVLKNILNQTFNFEGKIQYLNNIISSYTKAIVDSLNENKIDLYKHFIL